MAINPIERGSDILNEGGGVIIFLKYDKKCYEGICSRLGIKA